MRILDRHILLQFIKGLIISLFALILIYIIVDLFDRLSLFIDRGVHFTGILTYYLYELPSAILLLMPISVLIACFTSLGDMSRHFELVAVRASGVSFFRISYPILLFGVFLSISMLALGEGIVPIASDRKENFKRERIDKLPPMNYTRKRNFYFYGKENRLYHIDFIDARKNLLRGVTIYTFSRDSRLIKRLDSQRAKWSGGKWIFFSGMRREWNGDKEQVTKFDRLGVRYLPETMKDFMKRKRKPEDMNFVQLKHYINIRLRSGEDVQGELCDLHYKISYPFINFIILLLGIPLASGVRRSGFILGFAVSMLASFLYWGFMQLARAFGKVGTLPPSIASWMPNIIFGAVGIILFIRARKS
jgi:lipopolysaccharide export system permease protein